MYATEFGSYPKSYYETAISQGRILVSDKKVPLSYIVKGGDVLSHTVHRHEPGVAVQSEVEPHVTLVDGEYCILFSNESLVSNQFGGSVFTDLRALTIHLLRNFGPSNS